MIDFQLIQDVIEEWAMKASGIRAFWRGMDVGLEGRPHLEMKINGSAGLGIDEGRVTVNETTGATETCQAGNRLFTLSIKAHTRDQRPTGCAAFYLEKIRTALQKAWSRAALARAQLAVVESLPLVDLDAIFDNREESIAMLDVRMATVVNEVDQRDAGTIIEKILVTSDLKTPDGVSLPASLQLDDEEMP